MPRALALAMLILPPLLALLGGTFFLALAIRFRKGFGAIHDLPPGGKALILAALIVHAGYLAAPFLHVAHKRAIALWLTSPIAIAATLTLVVVIARANRSVEPTWTALAVCTALVLYWTPIAALIWGR